MFLWHAVILGLVEGITEYLPVSSSGHLIIVSALLGLDEPPEVKAAADVFVVVMQGGAILAVLGLYWRRVVQMLRGLVGRDAAGRRLLTNLLVAFMPAAVLGVPLAGWIEDRLFHPLPVLAALFLGGLWMIWIDRRQRKRADGGSGTSNEITLDELSWKRALLIGLFQVVAMWPGTSRSMMTIAGGTVMGLRPKEAAEFSFLLGLPTLGGACVYRLGTNVIESRSSGSPMFYEALGLAPVLVGIVVATISAALAVRWLVAFLTRHGLSIFGWYRIALCGVLGAMIIMKIVDLG